MASGMRFWDFISEELPALCRSWFPISNCREDTFAAGLSMGGYGAFRLGLTHPDRYAAVASLSGALDVARIAHEHARGEERAHKMGAIFTTGEPIAGTDSDLMHLVSKMSDSDREALKLYQCCGTEDFLYEDNQRFLKHAQEREMDLTYEEESGTHDWGYWDHKIQRVLEWLPINTGSK
jgi:S-formylglutathione hydrolase FrmB